MKGLFLYCVAPEKKDCHIKWYPDLFETITKTVFGHKCMPIDDIKR